MMSCKAVFDLFQELHLQIYTSHYINHDIINYSTSICPFEFGKCEKEGKNYKNLNILKIWKFENLNVFKGL